MKVSSSDVSDVEIRWLKLIFRCRAMNKSWRQQDKPTQVWDLEIFIHTKIQKKNFFSCVSKLRSHTEWPLRRLYVDISKLQRPEWRRRRRRSQKKNCGIIIRSLAYLSSSHRHPLTRGQGKSRVKSIDNHSFVVLRQSTCVMCRVFVKSAEETKKITESTKSTNISLNNIDCKWQS